VNNKQNVAIVKYQTESMSGSLAISLEEITQTHEKKIVPTKIKLVDHQTKPNDEKEAQIKAALLFADASGATFVKIKSGLSQEKNQVFYRIFQELKEAGLFMNITHPLMDKKGGIVQKDGSVMKRVQTARLFKPAEARSTASIPPIDQRLHSTSQPQ
jgi:hypothetical protein